MWFGAAPAEPSPQPVAVVEEQIEEVQQIEMEEDSAEESMETEEVVTIPEEEVIPTDIIEPEPETAEVINQTNKTYMWSNYQKPSKDELKNTLDPLVYKVTQEDGTERRHTSPLDKNWEDGIYVDVLSGEPLYSSKDKFDSGTGWPSFVKPITPDALTEHTDKKLFVTRTETRSAIADNHIGHVFTDGPADRGGLRYCMNGAALWFVPKDQMEAEGYGDFLQYI